MYANPFKAFNFNIQLILSTKYQQLKNHQQKIQVMIVMVLDCTQIRTAKHYTLNTTFYRILTRYYIQQ